MPREFVILHAPSPLGLKPPGEGRVPGVQHMPEALKKAGLHDAIRAKFAGEVRPPPYVPDRDLELRVRNPYAIAQYSTDLAAEIAPLLDGPDFPIVLGGDCSILLGAALALRRRGRFGVIYLDAHSDCQSPEISTTGGVAGMPLAIATGRGPVILTQLDDLGPYFADGDVELIGCRDLFDIVGAQEKTVAGTRIRVRDLEEVRRTGPEQIARDALGRISEGDVEGVWVHLDVDVLDPAIMPAVDSPDPGGLSAAELKALLVPLVCSPKVSGMQITIYDPERDPDGSAAALIVDVITEALATA